LLEHFPILRHVKIGCYLKVTQAYRGLNY